MHAYPLIPTTLSTRYGRDRRNTGVAALLLTVGGALSPLAWVLAPLALARAYRVGATWCAVVGIIAWSAAGVCWIDPHTLAGYPAEITGPWLALLVGAMAASAAWACERRRSADELLRAAGLLTLVAVPWSPLAGLTVALSCWFASARAALPCAANDNQPGHRQLIQAHTISALTYSPLHSIRPAMRD